MRNRWVQLLLLSFVAILLAASGTAIAAQEEDTEEDNTFAQLEYRHIGPVGNRVSAVVGVPGDPNIYYFGAASGGVFKTTDGGVHWKPIFDDQPVPPSAPWPSLPPIPTCLGRHGRGQDPEQRLRRRRHLQIHRRGQDLDPHGARENRPHRPHRHPPRQSRYRSCCGPRPLLRTPGGARRLSEPPTAARPGSGSSSSTRTPGLPTGHGPEQSAHPLRRHVADADLDLGTAERRAGKRPLPLERRRRDLGAADRKGLTEEPLGEGGPRHDAPRFGPHLRPHRNQLQRRLRRARRSPGCSLAIG